MKSIDLGTATVSAEFSAEIIGKRLLVITKEQMKRVNSISADTCDTMLKTGRLLQSFPILNHNLQDSCCAQQTGVHDIGCGSAACYLSILPG